MLKLWFFVWDTRIFRTPVEAPRLYLSTSNRSVRCPFCITMHNDAQLIHANLTHHIH